MNEVDLVDKGHVKSVCPACAPSLAPALHNNSNCKL